MRINGSSPRVKADRGHQTGGLAPTAPPHYPIYANLMGKIGNNANYGHSEQSEESPIFQIDTEILNEAALRSE
jgi:hypothetical protein